MVQLSWLLSMQDSTAQKSILLVAANPKGTVSLRLQEEEREIKERLRLAGYDKAPINSTGATRPRDIQRAMLDFKPQIVHFTGHGAGENGLAFEDAGGQLKLVSSEALANLFELFSDRVECVVLNACYSDFQAKAISEHIDYVIGMSQAIGDRAAIEFAVGFYTAIGAGESIEFAYKLGCNAIQLEGIPEYLTPVLHLRNNLANAKENVSKAKYIVILSTTIDEVDKPLLEAIVNHLRQISGDTSLTLQRIETGSIRLVLEGSQEGFTHLSHLFRAGEFSEVLGIVVQDIVLEEDAPQTPTDEGHVLHTISEQEFLAYLQEQIGMDAAQWLELYLEGQSLEQIAQSMNLSIRQAYRLRERISYHAMRFFRSKGQPELFSTLLRLQPSLIDSWQGLNPTQEQQFWQSLNPIQKQILEKLRNGETIEEIARQLNSEDREIEQELNELLRLVELSKES